MHTSEEHPLQLEPRFVNPGLAPHFIDHDLTEPTALQYLLKHIPITEVGHIVDATAADAKIGRIPDFRIDTPCLGPTRRTLLDTAIFTRVKMVHPGDQFRLTGRFPGSALAAAAA